MTHFCQSASLAAIAAALIAGATTANAQTTVITREPVQTPPRTLVNPEPRRLTPGQPPPPYPPPPVGRADRFAAALADGADIAIASRYVAGSIVDRPWWRTLMGQVFRACVHAVVPIDVRDTQCGGKMYTAEAAKDLFARSTLDGFAFDAEVLFLARRQGYRVAEIPFQFHQEGPTTIAFLRDSPRMFRDLLLIRWNTARGRYGPATAR